MDAHVRDLRYFVAVAEELSFTRAANDRLFVSQPALSKQIRQLETSLRTKLFDRDRRTVTLTAAGVALLPHALRVIEQWEEAQRAVAAAEDRSTLAVGFQTRIGRGLIPSVIIRMNERLPDWRLQFRQVPWNDPTTGLADGSVDVAIAWLPIPDGDEFVWRTVATENRWVALWPCHPLAAREVIPFEDLADEPFIALPQTSGAQRDFWLANDQRSKPALIGAEAVNAEETFEAVAALQGIALVSAGNATIYQRDDVVFRPIEGLPPSELAVVWRAGETRESVRVFVDACLTCLCADSPGQHMETLSSSPE
jgi:DNA-binding transcriptional LysR family regulator